MTGSDQMIAEPTSDPSGDPELLGRGGIEAVGILERPARAISLRLPVQRRRVLLLECGERSAHVAPVLRLSPAGDLGLKRLLALLFLAPEN